VPSTEDPTPFKVSLDEPIVIQAGLIYTVKSLPYGNIGHFGSSFRSVCVTETVKFRFSNHSESKSTSVTRGQIPRLYFCCL